MGGNEVPGQPGVCTACGAPSVSGRFCRACGAPIPPVQGVAPPARSGVSPAWFVVGVVGAVAVLLLLIGIAGLVFLGKDSDDQAVIPLPLDPSEEPPGGSSEFGDDAAPSAVETPATTQLAPAIQDLGGVTATADRWIDTVGSDCEGEIRYDPSLVLDGRPETAWGVSGSGAGERLYLDLGRQSRVQRVGLIPGYAKTDPCSGADRFTGNRVVRSVMWTFDDGTQVVQEFDPQATMQEIDVDVVTETIEIEILESGFHPDAVRSDDDTLISEVMIWR